MYTNKTVIFPGGHESVICENVLKEYNVYSNYIKSIAY